MSALLSAIASGVLALAVLQNDGAYTPAALVLCLGALVILVAGASGRWARQTEQAAGRALVPALGALVSLGIWGLVTRPPGVHLAPGTSLSLFQAGVFLAGLLALSYARPGLPYARLRFGLIVADFLLLAFWQIRASPQPPSDVWVFQEHAARLLLDGKNPYATYYPNIYGDSAWYGEVFLKKGFPYSLAYPPLTVLLDILGVLIGGDVRYALAMAVAGAAIFAVAAGRRLGLPPGHPAELAAVALLFHPRGFLLIEQGWTEPLMALTAAAVGWALGTRRRLDRLVSLSLFLDSRQHAVLWLPALLASRRVTFGDALRASLMAAAVVIPFFLWNPAGLWSGLVQTQFAASSRPDALSLVVVLGGRLPAGLGLAAAAVVMALVARRGAAGPGQEALAGAAIFTAFFVVSKQALFNSYWLVGALLTLATVAGAADLTRPARP